MAETRVVVSLGEMHALHALRALSPAQVYECVDEARENQLRAVPAEEFNEYQACELRIAQLRNRWRDECAPPSKPLVTFQ